MSVSLITQNRLGCCANAAPWISEDGFDFCSQQLCKPQPSAPGCSEGGEGGDSSPPWLLGMDGVHHCPAMPLLISREEDGCSQDRVFGHQGMLSVGSRRVPGAQSMLWPRKTISLQGFDPFYGSFAVIACVQHKATSLNLV